MQRLVFLLASAAPGALGLLFQSHKVSSQWDTWAICENGTYHAFFLANVSAPSFGLGTGSDGAAHAVSADGAHFEDRGEAWRMPPLPGLCGGEWRCSEGTSSVFARPGSDERSNRKKFSINYSVCRNNDKGELAQTISFAESDDLETWTQVLDDGGAPLLFSPDGRYYRAAPTAAAKTVRWDTLTGFVAGAEPGEVYGYWTASPLDGAAAFGMGATSDGLRWRALPPPAVVGAAAELGDLEIGGVAKFGGRFFALGGAGWEMRALVADAPAGPFRAAPRNFRVLSGAGYFTRFFDGCDGAVLVSHQAFHHPNHFLAPYKAAEVDADGALRLKWWPGNDALAGARVDRWEKAPLDLAVGVVLGGRVDLRGARAPANASGAYAACLPGFEFALTDGSSLVVLVDGCAEFNHWFAWS